MAPQGEFEIHVQAPVIFTVAKSPFNPEGVKRMYDAVLDAAQTMDAWILFEQPQSTAVFPGDATRAIVENYQELSQQGCAGIALSLSNVVARFLTSPNAMAGVNVPFMASRNPIELSHFVSQHAENIETQASQMTG